MTLRLLLIALLLPAPAFAETFYVDPGEPWCDLLNAADLGDEVVLKEGEHAGPCWITASGSPTFPVVLRGEEGPPVRVTYTGSSSNVIDADADHLTFRNLNFGPTEADVDAIKIRSGADVTVEGCLFQEVGGVSVSASSAHTNGLVIRGNEFRDLRSTGVYLGSHDGEFRSTDYLVEGNLFDGVDSEDIGYGVQAKLDSWGTVQDNVIHDTKGPGIEIYGSVYSSARSLVHGNLVIGSREAASLELAGGPVDVRANVIIGGATAALLAYDYGDRGLQRQIQVVGNTLLGEQGPAVILQGWGPDQELLFANNVGGHLAAGDGLPPLPEGVEGGGNIDCSLDCWRDAAARDLWPADAMWELGEVDRTLYSDEDRSFCGRSRDGTAGAIEGSYDGGGPLVIDFKHAQPCPEVEEEEDDLFEPDYGLRCGVGCGGCAHGAGAHEGVVTVLLLLPLALRRRRA
jgi:hypothetical protein